MQTDTWFAVCAFVNNLNHSLYHFCLKKGRAFWWGPFRFAVPHHSSVTGNPQGLRRLGIKLVLAMALAEVFVPLGTAAEEPHSSIEKAIELGSLELKTYWLRETPGGAKVAAGYVSICNTSDEPDRLIGASSSIAGAVEIHSMTMEDGMMRMRQMSGGLEIPPQGKVDLKPGSMHLMFVDLKVPLRSGESFSVRLQFEKAGAAELDFPVATHALGSEEPGRAAEPRHMH
jgi:copper(I)-binding protein